MQNDGTKQHGTSIVSEPNADELALILQRAIAHVTGCHEEQRTDCKKPALHLWCSRQGRLGEKAEVICPKAGGADPCCCRGMLLSKQYFKPAPWLPGGLAHLSDAFLLLR